MRRVLVPLDGSEMAAAILPEARRLAGVGGELILLYALGQRDGSDEARVHEAFLERIADTQREEGLTVRTEVVSYGDVAVGVDAAAETLHVDIVAAATHGFDPVRRLSSGSIALRVLGRSRVPVLLRHVVPQPSEAAPEVSAEPRIMVPLDGSELAERALPLACQLAAEWSCELLLVSVASDPPDYEASAGFPDEDRARAYLDRLVQETGQRTRGIVGSGSAVRELVDAARAEGVTDVVMTSVGRTAVSRVIVGSVADELIQQLTCAVIVVPVLALFDVR